jgi:glutamate decarboxylase
VPAFLLAGGASDVTVMRVMCRRGFEMDMAALLVEDFKAALAFLDKHGAPKISASEGTGFHHN